MTSTWSQNLVLVTTGVILGVVGTLSWQPLRHWYRTKRYTLSVYITSEERESSVVYSPSEEYEQFIQKLQAIFSAAHLCTMTYTHNDSCSFGWDSSPLTKEAYASFPRLAQNGNLGTIYLTR